MLVGLVLIQKEVAEHDNKDTHSIKNGLSHNPGAFMSFQ